MLLIGLMAIGSTAIAQTNVNAQMWCVNHGTPQKLMIEESGEVVCFDRKGRVTSYSIGTDVIRYSWSGNKITLSGYQNGTKVGEEYITISSQTDTEIVLTLSGGSIRETYNSDGQEHQSFMTSNGQTLTETVSYENDALHTPSKIVRSLGNQSETVIINSLSRDTYGNWVKMSISSNGQTQTVTRSILYYE